MRWTIKVPGRSLALCAFVFLSGIQGLAREDITWDDFPPSLRERMKENGITLDDVRENIALRKERQKRQAEEKDEEKTQAKPAAPEQPDKGPPPVPRPWPSVSRAVTLDLSVVSVETDGIIEETVYARCPQIDFSFRAIADLVVAPDQSGCSGRLVDLYLPENQLELFLFPRGLFLPSITESNIEGVLMGLEKQYGDQFHAPEKQDWVPSYTFKVDGNPWGKLSYRLGSDPENSEHYTELYSLVDGYTLVFRLKGNAGWVAEHFPQAKRALSGLEKE